MQEMFFVSQAFFARAALQPEADGQRRVDLIHDAPVRVAGMLAQAALVNGADLLEQNDGVLD